MKFGISMDKRNHRQSTESANLSKRKADEGEDIDASSIVPDDEPKSKRSRQAPRRFVPQTGDTSKGKPMLSNLTEELKKWSEFSLKSMSEYLQWTRDASSEELAQVVSKDKDAVDKLMNIIMSTEWKNVVLSNGFGSGILVNKDNDVSAEKPLDFWHQLCTMLTPAELNHSHQLAGVMKDIAEKSDDPEYGPIYEYLAIIMDDPASTVNMTPKLSGLQAGILLEILHGIAISVKESSHVQSILRSRALSVIEGDWETLKMPIREDGEAMTPWTNKRVSLQSLNPFAMPREALPKVRCRLPSQSALISAPPPIVTGPLPTSLRSMSSMNQLRTGFKTMHLIHEHPPPMPKYKKVSVTRQSETEPETTASETFLDIKRELTEFLDKTRPDT